MITITVESLQQQLVDTNKPEILFQNILYTRKKIFSKNSKNQAISLAEEYGCSQLKSILVEHKTFFSVWIEKSMSLTKQNLTKQKKPNNLLRRQQILKDKQMVKDCQNLENFLDSKLSDLGL